MTFLYSTSLVLICLMVCIFYYFRYTFIQKRKDFFKHHFELFEAQRYVEDYLKFNFSLSELVKRLKKGGHSDEVIDKIKTKYEKMQRIKKK